MKLASKLRVLLDCRHELRLHLLEGKLSFFLHVLPDALFVGGVPGEACDESPRLIQRHFLKVVLSGADSLHEPVHEHHRRRLRVVEVGVGLHRLSDRLSALDGLRYALRRLCGADRIAPDR